MNRNHTVSRRKSMGGLALAAGHLSNFLRIPVGNMDVMARFTGAFKEIVQTS